MQRWEYLEVWPDRVLTTSAGTEQIRTYLARCFPDLGPDDLKLSRPNAVAFVLNRLDVVVALGADGWEPIGASAGLVAMRRPVA